jgi:hypothetical protein
VIGELNFHLVHDLDEVMDIALLGEGPRPRRAHRAYVRGEEVKERAGTV